MVLLMRNLFGQSCSLSEAESTDVTLYSTDVISKTNERSTAKFLFHFLRTETKAC